MDKSKLLTLEDLSSVMSQTVPHVDTDLINKAYQFAEDTYREKKEPFRKDGYLFINHPLEVSAILCELKMDSETIAAGLLHDVLEDTPPRINSLRAAFGDTITQIVDGVTKLKDDDSEDNDKNPHKKKELERRKAENLKKLLTASAKDIRVIIVKLADRLHNMRTLGAHNTKKQKEIAEETKSIYAPLANKLGIYQIKWELEDLCFKTLKREAFDDLKKRLDAKRNVRDAYIQEVIQKIRLEFNQHSLDAKITGRAKHIYSIYHKMERLKKGFDEILDKSAVRIIVNNIEECYQALGIIHSAFTFIPETFDDYIARPKPNRYQSLHTAVIALGEPLEVQIRTQEMNDIAEHGVAAHWKYKEGKTENAKFVEQIAWARKLFERYKESEDSQEFFSNVKRELSAEKIITFTPKGDVIELLKGSTPIDFAYHIHTDVGNHCSGAKINSKIVPLSYKLKNEDIVSIIINKNGSPSRDWLSVVHTASARNKIRHFFRAQKKEECIEAGKEILQKEIAKQTEHKELFTEKNFEKILKRFRSKTIEDLYAGIGYGDYTVSNVINKLLLTFKKPKAKQVVPNPAIKRVPKNIKGIIVDGLEGIDVRISKCCSPVNGDEIVGLRTPRGVTIHKKICENINKLNNNRNNFVAVLWAEDLKIHTLPKLKIISKDKVGLLNEITNILKEHNINAEALNSKIVKENAVMDIVVNISDQEKVNLIINEIKKIKEVVKITLIN